MSACRAPRACPRRRPIRRRSGRCWTIWASLTQTRGMTDVGFTHERTEGADPPRRHHRCGASRAGLTAQRVTRAGEGSGPVRAASGFATTALSPSMARAGQRACYDPGRGGRGGAPPLRPARHRRRAPRTASRPCPRERPCPSRPPIWPSSAAGLQGVSAALGAAGRGLRVVLIDETPEGGRPVISNLPPPDSPTPASTPSTARETPCAQPRRQRCAAPHRHDGRPAPPPPWHARAEGAVGGFELGPSMTAPMPACPSPQAR